MKKSIHPVILAACALVLPAALSACGAYEDSPKINIHESAAIQQLPDEVHVYIARQDLPR